MEPLLVVSAETDDGHINSSEAENGVQVEVLLPEFLAQDSVLILTIEQPDGTSFELSPSANIPLESSISLAVPAFIEGEYHVIANLFDSDDNQITSSEPLSFIFDNTAPDKLPMIAL